MLKPVLIAATACVMALPAVAQESPFCTLGGWPDDTAATEWSEADIRCGEENKAREERIRTATETPEDWKAKERQKQAREAFGESWDKVLYALGTGICPQGWARYTDGRDAILTFVPEESSTTGRVFTLEHPKVDEDIKGMLSWYNGYAVANYGVGFECGRDDYENCGSGGRAYTLTTDPDAIADIPMMNEPAAETILLVDFGRGFYSAGRFDLAPGDVWHLDGCGPKAG